LNLKQEVVERLLIAKAILAPIRFQPVGEPDRLAVATHILSAHDAAELAIAAFAAHVGRLPAKDKSYLMDYFETLASVYPDEAVPGQAFFSQLNRVRVNFKHLGIIPDPKQWERVGERTYSYLSDLSIRYLSVSLDSVDESQLLSNEHVQTLFELSRQESERAEFKSSLECLGKALRELFKSNPALRNLAVGLPRADDAIRLAGFGVHANDFLVLQQFVPMVSESSKGELEVSWNQSEYGHPGNWRAGNVEFCQRAFLDLAIKIQGAKWIPGAVHFVALYEHKCTAVRDGVKIWTTSGGTGPLYTDSVQRDIKILNKGEFVRGRAGFVGRTVADLLGRNKVPGTIRIISEQLDAPFGDVLSTDVAVTCVPRESDLVAKYFPDLEEIEWRPNAQP